MNKKAGRLALKVASFYVIVAACWIYGSEEVVRHFVHDTDIRVKLSLLKGWGFVLVTGFLLYQFLYRLLVRWEHAKSAQQSVETRYRHLFENMNEGVAYCRMIFEGGRPVDFIYLAVNGQFTVQTGLRDVQGKRVSAVIPGLRASDPELFEIYGRVAQTGRPEKAERLVQALKMWFNISVFCPEPEHFVAVFDVVTERKLAQQQMADAANYVQTLLAASPIGIITYKATGEAVSANAAAAALVGTTAENVRRQNFRQLDSWKKSGFLGIAERALTTGQEQLFEGRAVSSYGVDLWLACRFVPFTFAGEPHLMLLAQDIGERRQSEEKLRDSEQKFQQLADNINDVFWIASPDFKTMHYVSRGYEEIWGRPVANLVRRPQEWLEAIVPEERERVFAVFNRLRQGTQVVDVEYRITRPDGTVRWIRDRGFQVRDAAGQVVRLTGIASDITERQQAAEANLRLATAVEQAAETIVITDTAGTILYANPAFEKTTGYTVAEALGQNPRVLKSGKQAAEFYRQMWAVLQRGEIWRGHFTNRRKDGTLFEEEAAISPIRDAAGKIISFVAVKRDVTREMELESQFRQSQKMEAIGQLAGGVAHDFNNILAVIQMQAGLLKLELPASQNDSAPHHDYAREIEKACQRAASLTNQLLLFSRKQPLQLRDQDLNEVVTSIVKMLQRILGEQTRMQIKLSSQPLPVHADTGMMDQLLMNLTVNARDAMPGGGTLELETDVVEFDEATAAQTALARPGRFVCVRVSDTGCGIAPDVLPRIFEPFFTTKEPGKGTGLGLATVFGIVQQHHGWINVTSEVGRGTSFRIYLPHLTRPVDNTAAWESLAAVLSGHETVLLVEDDTAVRDSVQSALSHLGYRVLTAANGSEAMTVWKTHRAEIRLLLTDLMMPGGMTGKDLAELLQQQEPNLKVVYASGYRAEIAVENLEEGVNFLPKPFEMRRLAQTVRNCLDKV